MITEVTLLLDRWLHQAKYGVNALLPGVPRDKIDGGTWDAPASVTIYNDIEDDCVLRELDPDDVPAVVVFCDEDEDISEIARTDKAGQKGKGLVAVFAYMDRDRDLSLSKLEGGLVLRAVRKSLSYLQIPRISDPLGGRRLNKISISKIDSITESRITTGIGRSTLIGFVTARIWTLDSDTTNTRTF